MPRVSCGRVLLIGWDAADWQVIHPLLDAGLMPNLQRLIEGGVMGNLASLSPMQAIQHAAQPPAVFVQVAAIGIYGDTGARACDEDAMTGGDFVAETCQRWEAAFAELAPANTRKVLLRLGVVLGRDGGILKVLGKLTRLFLGGQAGNGRQFVSWIHMADVTRMILWAIECHAASGVFNATAPNPVTNAEFMRELRRALHRPWSPPVPELAVRLGASLLGSEPGLALTSQRARPKHFLETGFPFAFAELRPALASIYPRG